VGLADPDVEVAYGVGIHLLADGLPFYPGLAEMAPAAPRGQHRADNLGSK